MYFFITVRKRSLRRLCFYICLSVILFTGGGGCLGPGLGRLRDLPGGGVSRPRPGGVSQHALRKTPPPHPQQTATAMDGTHPTGMHSCLKKFLENISPFCGYTDILVLYFWWHLPRASKPLSGQHGSQDVLIHILVYKHRWDSSPGSSVLLLHVTRQASLTELSRLGWWCTV